MYSGGPSCSTQPSQKRVLPSSHCWCWLAGPPLRRVATLHCVPPSCNGRLNAFAGEHIEAYYLRRYGPDQAAVLRQRLHDSGEAGGVP